MLRSIAPFVIAASLPLIGYGIIFNLGFAAVGAFVLFLGVYGLGLEPSTDPDAGHDGHGGHGGHDDDGAHAELEAPEEQEQQEEVVASD